MTNASYAYALMPPAQFLQIASNAKRVVQWGNGILDSFHDAFGMAVQSPSAFKLWRIYVFECWEQLLASRVQLEESKKSKTLEYFFILTKGKYRTLRVERWPKKWL